MSMIADEYVRRGLESMAARALRSLRERAADLLREAPRLVGAQLPTRRRRAVELRHEIHALRVGRPDGLDDNAWADWLAQRGDPRGETFALVLAALRAFDTRACEGTPFTPPTTDTPPLVLDSGARMMALCEAPESSGAGEAGLRVRAEWVMQEAWRSGAHEMIGWKCYLLSTRSIQRQRYGGPPDWAEYCAVVRG